MPPLTNFELIELPQRVFIGDCTDFNIIFSNYGNPVEYN